MKLKKLSFFLIFICIILVATLVMIKALLWTDSSIQYTSTTSYSPTEALKEAQESGGILYLNSDKINSLLQSYAKELKVDGKLKVGIPHVEVKQSRLICYIPVSYGNLDLIASCTGTLKLQDDNFIFTPQRFKLGKVPLPKKLVMKKLSSYSNTNVTIADTYINIRKDILPINLSSLVVDGDTIIVKINTSTSSSTADKKINKSNSSSKNSTTQEKQQANVSNELLFSTSNQLRKVYDSVKTANEKMVISMIQNSVAKLIEEPSFNIAAETEEVKKQYGKLSETERTDLKESILNNMNYNTLIDLKSRFGL